jgi:hypothetical protein
LLEIDAFTLATIKWTFKQQHNFVINLEPMC